MDRKVALVTGASSGIGAATARRLHDGGCLVHAGARRVARMQDLAEDGISVVALDVADDSSMTGVVAKILADHGRIDVLVKNAGYGSYGSVEDVPLAEGRYQLEVNLFGLPASVVVLCTGLVGCAIGGLWIRKIVTSDEMDPKEWGALAPPSVSPLHFVAGLAVTALLGTTIALALG